MGRDGLNTGEKRSAPDQDLSLRSPSFALRAELGYIKSKTSSPGCGQILDLDSDLP